MIAREIERSGIPVVQLTAMALIAQQLGVNRVVQGVKVAHPLGDPALPADSDKALRREIVKCALQALQTAVKSPTVFVPDITYSVG